MRIFLFIGLHRHRYTDLDKGASTALAVNRQATLRTLSTSLHTDQAERTFADFIWSGEALPIVLDRQEDALGILVQSHSNQGGTRMPGHVRQCFLCDAKEMSFRFRRQPAAES